MKILFLTTILLSQHCNGGEVASQTFIDVLRHQGYCVDVVGYQRQGDYLDPQSAHQFIVDQRCTETSKSKRDALHWMIAAFWQRLPYSSAKYYSRRYISIVKSLLTSQSYDAIVIDHAQIGWIADLLQQVKCPVILLAHNLEHEIYQQHAQRTKNAIARWIYQREAHLIQAIETRLARWVDQVWTLTAHDAAYFSEITTKLDAIKVVNLPPRGSSESILKEYPKVCDVGLLGSWSWTANQEALSWFLKEIYPNLPSHWTIHVAGKGADWLRGKYSNLHYQGVVPDAQVFMAQARVIALPTLRGGGIQIKTLDAIASGSAIVATPTALRGIANLPSTIRVVSDALSFTQQLIDLVAATQHLDATQEARTWCRDRNQQFSAALESALLFDRVTL
jgi:polysaccharide biosynthesis protein PslH